MKDLTFRMALYIGIFQVLEMHSGNLPFRSDDYRRDSSGNLPPAGSPVYVYLAVPVMFGASFLKIIKFGLDFSGQELMILIVGMAVAFAVSIFAIKFLMGYIKKHDFKVFGWYRIILGTLVLGYFAAKNFLA